MGKTSKPLTFLVTSPDIIPYLKELVEKGHTIDMIDTVNGPPYDRVIGPNCYKLTPEMLDNLPKNTLDTLIKGARVEKFGATTTKKKVAKPKSEPPTETPQPELPLE